MRGQWLAWGILHSYLSSSVAAHGSFTLGFWQNKMREMWSQDMRVAMRLKVGMVTQSCFRVGKITVVSKEQKWIR